MQKITVLALLTNLLCSCNPNTKLENNDSNAVAIQGTWQLISGTTIEKNDTVVTDYTQKLSFIKIINDSHFAFLKHDLNKGEDSSTAAFGAGGGKYMLVGSTYTEHLEYCNAREWESNDFTFTVTIKNDTLVQSGIEKVDGAGINRTNIEKYVRVKK